MASLFRLGAARAARSSACGSRHFGGAVSLSSSSSACSFRIVAAARGAAFAPLRTCAGVRSFAAATTFDLKPLVVPEKTAEEFRATETPSNDEVSKGGYPILHAVVRRGAGSKYCDTDVRSKGFMPAVLQGRKKFKDELLMVDALHLVRAFKERGRAFENTLYSLRVADEDGNTVRTALVLPRSVTYHPIKRFPIAVTFYNYNANIGARVDVPIVYDLSSAKMPGFLNTMHEQVRCFVKGNAIPSQIYINMADYVDARCEVV